MTVVDDPAERVTAPAGRRVAPALVAVISAALLVIAVAAGYVWGHAGASGGVQYPSASSVDAGFARDMATHHQQAVTMATYAQLHSNNTLVKEIAYDIESSQSVQMGEMQGWLAEWGVSQNTGTPMSWMPDSSMAGMSMPSSPNALMPGMATPAQMARLQKARGKASDVLFLQLMIRHHQGGLPMARYAAAHAQVPAVRQLAANIVVNQTREISQMTALLKQLGGRPLPPPS